MEYEKKTYDNGDSYKEKYRKGFKSGTGVILIKMEMSIKVNF